MTFGGGGKVTLFFFWWGGGERQRFFFFGGGPHASPLMEKFSHHLMKMTSHITQQTDQQNWNLSNISTFGWPGNNMFNFFMYFVLDFNTMPSRLLSLSSSPLRPSVIYRIPFVCSLVHLYVAGIYQKRILLC